MRIVTLSPEQFDKFASKHRYRNYYQSSVYGKTMRKFGFNIHFLGIADESNTLIGASLIIYREVFMGHKIAYAPRGILFNYDNPSQLHELVELLKKVLGKQGFMMLKIDPYIPATIRDNKGNIMNFNSQVNLIMANLKSAGFIHQGRTLFFEGEKPRWEALTMLNKDIREIFNSFDKRTRHKIRKAATSGIECFKDEKEVSKYVQSLWFEYPEAMLGIAINPSTSMDLLEDCLHLFDYVLVMSVEPGMGGQKFNMEAVERIKRIKQIINEKNLDLLIQVDGGINDKTSKLCIDAGARLLVCGSYLFANDSEEIEERVNSIVKDYNKEETDIAL